MACRGWAIEVLDAYAVDQADDDVGGAGMHLRPSSICMSRTYTL